MKKRKIGVCGFLDRKKSGENGQTIKTLAVLYELERVYGKEQVISVSTHNWKKKPFKLFFEIFSLAFKTKNVVIFPDQNGIRVILPILYILKVFFRFKLFYAVVGAWLPYFLDKHKIIKIMVSKIDKVFVESRVLETQLQERNVLNTLIMNNFKQIEAIKDPSIYCGFPYKLCYFSRVIKQKGIEDAIEVVKKINNNVVRCIFDIYGPIDEKYKEEFNELVQTFPNYIKYLGVIDPFSTVCVLKEYYLHLFPTKYATEGVPGSIIDSYFSGLPVLVSDWNSSRNVVMENITGIIYAFNDNQDFYNKLNWCLENEEQINKMRLNCVEESKKYNSKEIIKVLINELK